MPIEVSSASNYCLPAVHRPRDGPTGRDGGGEVVQRGTGNPVYSENC